MAFLTVPLFVRRKRYTDRQSGVNGLRMRIMAIRLKTQVVQELKVN